MEKVDTMKKEEKIVLSEESIESLMKSEEDIRAGRLVDAETVFKMLRDKYGI